MKDAMKPLAKRIAVAGLLFAMEILAFSAAGPGSTTSPGEEKRLWQLPPQVVEHLMPIPLFHVRESFPTFDVVISSDGRRIAYAVWKGHKQVVVVDGDDGPAWEGIGLDMLLFSPDA